MINPDAIEALSLFGGIAAGRGPPLSHGQSGSPTGTTPRRWSRVARHTRPTRRISQGWKRIWKR